MPGGKYVTIPWSDGTSDNLYLDFSTIVEDYTVTVSSDKNTTGVERYKILKFKGAMPDGSTPEYQAEAYLKLVQQVDDLVIATFENNTSIYNDSKAGFFKS